MNSTALSRKLSKEMKTAVLQAVHEVLSDPDFGLELTDKAKKRLRSASVFRGKTLSFQEIKKKYS